jgi:hypothetical protein
MVLACFSDAVAQASYTVKDLGRLHNWNLGCAMGLNNQGWTEIMEGNLPPGQQDSSTGTLLTGRVVVDVDGLKIDIGTLGGKNSWTNYDGINDRGQAAGYSEQRTRTRTAKTYASSAHTLRVVRFFGKTAT